MLHCINLCPLFDVLRTSIALLCLFFRLFLVHIAHLRQGINLSSENEKSASQCGFFFVSPCDLNDFFQLYSYILCKMYTKNGHGWWVACMRLWIEHFSERCSLKNLCSAVSSNSKFHADYIASPHITSLYLITWDLNHYHHPYAAFSR